MASRVQQPSYYKQITTYPHNHPLDGDPMQHPLCGSIDLLIQWSKHSTNVWNL